MTFADKLVKMGACREAVHWVRKNKYGLKRAWANCPERIWISWLLNAMVGKTGWPTEARVNLVGDRAIGEWRAAYRKTLNFYEADKAEMKYLRAHIRLGKV